MGYYDSQGRPLQARPCPRCGNHTINDFQCQECGQWSCNRCEIRDVNGRWRCGNRDCQSLNCLMRHQLE